MTLKSAGRNAALKKIATTAVVSGAAAKGSSEVVWLLPPAARNAGSAPLHGGGKDRFPPCGSPQGCSIGSTCSALGALQAIAGSRSQSTMPATARPIKSPAK
ncbi:hypothetical protein CUR178_08131 [Leishmania enriettii]|uniref:Uncharacterized protein n=1 Tax=Leishmania enriettii TaxID=5663 RepID=A0A836H3I4_LEIEN|nr:hypothetical protein CUR178_08131 [Leishmania enriettii]